MGIFRKLILVLLCASVFAGGMAHASVPCCLNQDDMSMCMKMKGDAAKPCHDASDKGTKNTPTCNGCDCGTCMKMGALLPDTKLSDQPVAPTIAGIIPSMDSSQPDGIFQPPKQIS